MKQQEYNLSIIGYAAKYVINEQGIIYNQEEQKQVKVDNKNRVYIQVNSGNYKRITLKTIYRKIFNKELCIDTIENFEGEQWKEIENTKGKYFVSHFGRIKSYCGNRAKILEQFVTKEKYCIVKINYKNYKIHRLVAFAFCDDKDKSKEVHHKDKNRLNNHLNNLLILTKDEHRKIHNKKENKDNE